MGYDQCNPLSGMPLCGSNELLTRRGGSMAQYCNGMIEQFKRTYGETCKQLGSNN